MDLTEKIAYIKGLCEGLSLDESKPEVKVLNAVVDLLDDLAYEVQDMQELYDELSAVVDEIDEDLADVESELYDDDDDEDDFDDFDEDDDDFDDDDDVFYEVTCDACGKLFADAEGTTVITADDTVVAIDPDALAWGDWHVTVEP